MRAPTLTEADSYGVRVNRSEHTCRRRRRRTIIVRLLLVIVLTRVIDAHTVAGVQTNGVRVAEDRVAVWTALVQTEAVHEHGVITAVVQPNTVFLAGKSYT